MASSPPQKPSSGFLGGFGAIALALGVGALGVYALDYHRHSCEQCGARWGHFGAFNLGDEASHTCSHCGQVQWWKCGAPHVLRGSQFVDPPTPPASAFANVPTVALPPEYTYTPAVPPPAYAPPTDFSYAPPAHPAYAPSAYAQPAYAPPPQPAYALPPQQSAYAMPSHATVRTSLGAPPPTRSPYANAPTYAPAASYALEYARVPTQQYIPERAPAYARASVAARPPEYGQPAEPTMAVAIRPRDRWR